MAQFGKFGPVVQYTRYPADLSENFEDLVEVEDRLVENPHKVSMARHVLKLFSTFSGLFYVKLALLSALVLSDLGKCDNDTTSF